MLSLEFHLAPPMFNKPDPITGRPKKTKFGPWAMTPVQAAGQDESACAAPSWTFSATAKTGQTERRLIAEYEDANAPNCSIGLSSANHTVAVALAGSARPNPRLRPGEGCELGDGEGEGGRAAGAVQGAGRSGGCLMISYGTAHAVSVKIVRRAGCGRAGAVCRRSGQVGGLAGLRQLSRCFPNPRRRSPRCRPGIIGRAMTRGVRCSSGSSITSCRFCVPMEIIEVGYRTMAAQGWVPIIEETVACSAMQGGR